jgi:hypothetical protein
VGFRATTALNGPAHASALNPVLLAADCPATTVSTAGMTHFQAGKAVGASLATAAHLPTNTIGDQQVANMTYVAGAAGVVHKQFTDVNSVAFIIDEQKVIRTIRNGFKLKLYRPRLYLQDLISTDHPSFLICREQIFLPIDIYPSKKNKACRLHPVFHNLRQESSGI